MLLNIEDIYPKEYICVFVTNTTRIYVGYNNVIPQVFYFGDQGNLKYSPSNNPEKSLWQLSSFLANQCFVGFYGVSLIISVGVIFNCIVYFLVEFLEFLFQVLFIKLCCFNHINMACIHGYGFSLLK